MANHFPAHVGLPMLKRMLRQQFVLSTEKIWCGDNVVVAGRGVYRFQINIPLDGRRQFPDLRQAHLVVHVFRVAALDVIHLRLGHGGFQFNHGARVGAGLRFRFSHQHKHLLQMRAEFLESFYRLLVGVDVIVAIGQA